jgi:asparagine synthase (glutamine-hydrolysing)
MATFIELASHSPVPAPPATEVLTWSGRVDNRADLRLQLGGDGWDDDAALVLGSYRRWGVAGLARPIGDWSIAIRDRARAQVVLASDYMGACPLYYHVDRDRVSSSTRLDALVEATGVDELDEQYIAGFLQFGRCPHRTPYAGIRCVPAGHAVCVTAEGVTTHRFWTPPTQDLVRYRDEGRYEEQFRALFREAVAARLQRRGPVLAELSGGLDSSSVVCLAAELIRQGAVPATRLVTVSYVHRESSDLPFIREVEASCGLHGVHLSTHDLPLTSAADVGWGMPEGWMPLYHAVASLARRVGATTLLTGQNGDLVTGNWFDDSLQVAGPLRRLRLGRACADALAWSQVLRVPVAHILGRACRAAWPWGTGATELDLTEGAIAVPRGETSLAIGFRERLGLTDPLAFFSTAWTDAPPERRRHFQLLAHAQELRILQRLEPLHDIDYTHPFAHRPLVEFLMSVPPEILCRPGEPRRLMRRALSEWWPAALRGRRSKSLFGTPWHDAMRPLAAELLRSQSWQVVERGWVDAPSLRARLGRLVRGLECNEAQLRLVVLLEMWLRHRRSRSGAPVVRTA